MFGTAVDFQKDHARVVRDVGMGLVQRKAAVKHAAIERRVFVDGEQGGEDRVGHGHTDRCNQRPEIVGEMDTGNQKSADPENQAVQCKAEKAEGKDHERQA